MAKVYGVFQGQYSDWKCVGYFEDEDSAWIYCNLRNKDLDDYDSMYVMPIREIECDLSALPKGYFVYRFMYHFKDGEWKLYPDYCRGYDPEDHYEDERLEKYETEYAAPYCEVRKYTNGAITACVRVHVWKNDMKEAQKEADELLSHYRTIGGNVDG